MIDVFGALTCGSSDFVDMSSDSAGIYDWINTPSLHDATAHPPKSVREMMKRTDSKEENVR